MSGWGSRSDGMLEPRPLSDKEDKEDARHSTPTTEVRCDIAGKGSYAAQPGARWLRHHIVGCDGLSRIFCFLVFLSIIFPSVEAFALDPFQESNGQVVMEAENHDVKVTRSSKSWNLLTTITGFSGTGYLQSLPNTGTLIDTGYPTTSPELQYRINFTTTGTYYIWMRGRGPTTSDDSIHAGMDGTAPSSAKGISSFPNSWTWSRSITGGVATIVVSITGLHTFNLWMREDGFIVDKILLRKDSSSTAPSGTGPAESPRGITSNRAPVINSISPVTGSKYYEQDAVTVSVGASDLDGDALEYQFSVNGTVKRAWGATSTYVLATTDRNYGKKIISISVRDNKGGVANASANLFFYKKPLSP